VSAKERAAAILLLGAHRGLLRRDGVPQSKEPLLAKRKLMRLMKSA